MTTDQKAILALTGENERLRARTEAALALHVWAGKVTLGVKRLKLCDECEKPIPCPTVEALKGEGE